ncbi:MAG: hypothetical protein Tsb0013_21840 [Phycisphaerales bacterium]
MDFGSPALLFSGMLIGMVGFVMFMYGRKEPDMRYLAAGIALSAIPFFAHSLLVMWGLSGACGVGLYLSKDMG